MKQVLLLFIIVCLVHTSLHASHCEGGDITYKHLSNFTYQGTVTTYTRASNYQADRDSLMLKWGDGDSSYAVRINGLNGQGELIGNDVKLNIYTSVHTYAGPGTFVLSITDPNRIDGILNMTNSVSVPLFLFATLVIADPGLNLDNSSPTFIPEGMMKANDGEEMVYNIGATETEGDCLHYSLIPPESAYGVDVPGYWGPDFVNQSFGNFFIDNHTGQIFWLDPESQSGLYDIAVEVKEFRYGTFVGSTMKDILIDLPDCLDEAPAFQQLNNIVATSGDTINFAVSATNNSSHFLKLNCYGFPFALGMDSSITDGIGQCGGQFHWITDLSMARDQSYLLIFEARDTSSCDDSGYYNAHQTITIQILPPPDSNIVFTPNCPDFTEVESLASEQDLKIYPNPVSDYLTIEIPDYGESQTTISISDLLGQIVKQDIATDRNYAMDVRNLRSGLYIVEVRQGHILARRKFIVQ